MELSGKRTARKTVRAAGMVAGVMILAAVVGGMLLVKPVARNFYPLKYGDCVNEFSSQNNLDPYLVYAVIKAESGFDRYALSRKDAIGLMQITETTGQWGADKLNLENYKKEDLYDPYVNVRIGCWYLAGLFKEFGGSLDLALAAYNSGSGNVSGWLKDRMISSTGTSLDHVPYKETDQFIKRVKTYYSMYKRLYE